MIKSLFTIFVFLLMGNLFANAEVVFYCTEELSTGIVKTRGVWKEVSFRLKRHTIRFNDDYTELYGLDTTTWDCKQPYPGVRDTKSLRVCYPWRITGEVFSFDKKSLRFLFVSGFLTGWILQDNYNDPDTNSMTAGTCKKF